ncbi:MAG TPA: hypothetical protein VGF32_10255 [Streptosporangiaceae bacterium]
MLHEDDIQAGAGVVKPTTRSRPRWPETGHRPVRFTVSRAPE